MKRAKYQSPEMGTVIFQILDVITTSVGGGVDLPLDPASDDATQTDF